MFLPITSITNISNELINIKWSCDIPLYIKR